ncbi:MAG: M23 family metallopeptidase [Holosporaceae bacterium]|nr:M23 family metallopeptidase [Holosporaceae bacterium]
MCRCKGCLIIVGYLLGGCERDRLAPVDIKVDQDIAHTSLGDMSQEGLHVVSDGESLFDVANKYDIDPMNLARINGIKYPYDVKDGQVLRLPPENPSEPIEAEEELARKKEKERLEKALDDEFSGVMATGRGRSANVGAASAGGSPVDVLSTPRATQTTVGSRIHPAGTPGKMVWPVDGGKVISRFGDVVDGISNDGINIKASMGTPIKAALSGEVIYHGNKLEEFGNTVVIQHGGNLVTSYAHLQDMLVQDSQHVNTGDVIGRMGKTGEVSSPQLHFEVLKNKVPVNPTNYLPK